jgi:hypothetical protein
MQNLTSAAFTLAIVLKFLIRGDGSKEKYPQGHGNPFLRICSF